MRRMTRSYRPWTAEETQWLREARLKGLTAAECGAHLGRTASQVLNKCTADAIPFEKSGKAALMPAPPPPRAPDPPRDPVTEAQERRERTKLLREERDALDAVAGERSLRATLDLLFREVVPAVAPPPRYVAPKQTRTTVTETALFHWSDWHYGEVVLPERVRGYNAYDQDIATTRVKSVVANGRSILDRLRTGGYRFDSAVIAVNGDLVTGTIHELEKHSNGKVITQSVAECGYLLAEAIRDVAADFPAVHVFCTVGNHGRLPDARRMEQKSPLRNWDALVAMFAQCALRECRNVTVTIPDAYAVGYDVAGHAFLQQHGHDIKSSLGIPWYGIQRYTSRIVALEASQSRPSPTFLFGHFHTATSLPHPGGEMFVNGSLIGATEYAVNSLGAADRPAQWLLGVHPEHGVTHRWPVYPEPLRGRAHGT